MSSLGLGDAWRLLTLTFTRAPIDFPMGYGEEGRWLSLSERIGRSALDMIDPSVASGTVSKGSGMSAVSSIGTVSFVRSFGGNNDIGYVQRALCVGTSNVRMSCSYVPIFH